ncbi:hypothetical protein CRE_03379 [Caenorhabditis remanei]|uniref:Uncharacterized protein n=2 Tax=Caenorhabditis remanei TaxID=31234 RepID=E3N645_CAERE|nr:hypothetical protein CRE_03379 [Caenorhabditis remanei]
MDPLSYPLSTFNVDYSATHYYSGYYPNTYYWNWSNYYYQNEFNYDQPTSSGYSFTTTSLMTISSTSSGSYSTATPLFSHSMTPSMPTMTPPTTTTPHRHKDSTRHCSNCFATETCQWKNVRSENGILCNACFIYQRKYKKTRPVTAMEKYNSKKAVRQSNSN